MKVTGIQCLKCLDKIYSEHRHDMKFCRCESVAIDGGREYIKVSGDPDNYKIIEIKIKKSSNK